MRITYQKAPARPQWFGFTICHVVSIHVFFCCSTSHLIRNKEPTLRQEKAIFRALWQVSWCCAPGASTWHVCAINIILIERERNKKQRVAVAGSPGRLGRQETGDQEISDLTHSASAQPLAIRPHAHIKYLWRKKQKKKQQAPNNKCASQVETSNELPK